MSDPIDYFRQRASMVEAQLSERGITDARVLAAMASVPREQFVPDHLRAAAYDDAPQLIGEGQTISQPYTVAFMAQAARVEPGQRVLEVGAGSGYGAAVLAAMGAEVHTLERLPELARQAAQRLERVGASAQVHHGDGTEGLPGQAPFDAIVVTAGAPHLPPAYAQQLAPGGRIVIPLGSQRQGQRLTRFELQEGKLLEEDLGAFAFVPLVGKYGWPA